ncbi:TPA: hypothetical protein ACH3X1_008443 [Trebouxia sp. C0004]
MSDDASGTVLLLRNAAAHAGQIKRELAAIIQSSGRFQSEWVPQIRGLSDPAARMLQGGLPQEYSELREPSVPDLSEVFGQGLGASARGEGVAPGEQQAPPKADDGYLYSPLKRPALSRGPQSYPIFSAMHSDDEASLSSEPSHNQIHKVKSTPVGTSQQQLQQQLQPIRTHSLASRQPLRGSPPPQQARVAAPWQPWRMYQTRGGEMYAHSPARLGSAPPYPYPAHATDASTPTDRSLSPDLSAMFDKGFLKTPRAAAKSPRPKRRARPALEPPAWDNSHKRAVVRGGAGLQRGDRGVSQQESLQELKQRFMARLQQANDGMSVNKIRRQQQAGSTAGAKRHSYSQENALMSSSRLLTVEKRIPYQALLRRRPSCTSSSMPVTPLKTRPGWATVGPKPTSDIWQASASLQTSPVKAVLPQHGLAGEEEDWPDLSHLKWEGAATGVVSGCPDVYSRAAASSQMGAQTTYLKGEAEMDLDVTGPVGNMAGRSKQRKMNSHFHDQNLMKQSSLQQRPHWGSPNALPSGPHSRAVSSCLISRRQNLQSSRLLQATHRSRLNSAATDEQSWHHPGNLPMTHPSKPLHTHISLDDLVSHADRGLPAQPWSRDTSELHLSVQQPARFHTSLHDLMAQGMIHNDQEPPMPEQPAAKSRQLNHSKSSQIQQGSAARYTRQLSAPPQHHGLHAPDDWESASAKQGERGDGRDSIAGRSMSSFASPTRSSAAKQQQRSLHKTSSRSRQGASSNALAGAASPAVGSSQAGGPPAPFMSTFRLADHSDEQDSDSHHDPEPPMQQPQVHQQQQAQQQEAQWQQAQRAQQAQPDGVHRQQHAQLQVQHAQQQQTQVEMSGAELMAEALGRLCQAATNSNKRSRAPSPAGSSTSHASHTSRHVHQAPSPAAVQSSVATAVASINSSRSRAASPAGSSISWSNASQHARHAHAADACSLVAAATASSRQHEGPAHIFYTASADTASTIGKPAQVQSGGQSTHAVPGGNPAQAPSDGQAISTIGSSGHSPDGEASSGHSPNKGEASSGHSPNKGEASSGHAEEKVLAGGSAGMLAALQRMDAQPNAQHSSTMSGSNEVASEQASDAQSLPASSTALTSQTDTGDLQYQGRIEDGPAAGSKDTTAVGNAAASSWSASTAVANDSDAANRSPPRPDSKAGTSQQDDSDTGAMAGPQAASSSGSPVTPAAAFSFRSTMGRLRGLDAAELQSPNRSKYGRSESRDPGVRIRDHPVGSVLLEAAPAVGSMTGADLLAALSKGSEMRKAWEGGSGGSNRLVQCFVNEGQACIAYGHGWLRKSVQYPLDRVHVPVTAWLPAQAVTVDTTKGAMDLEPVTEADYSIWVLGLNAALTVAQKPQTPAEVPVAQMLWHPDLFVMSS